MGKGPQVGLRRTAALSAVFVASVAARSISSATNTGPLGSTVGLHSCPGDVLPVRCPSSGFVVRTCSPMLTRWLPRFGRGGNIWRHFSRHSSSCSRQTDRSRTRRRAMNKRSRRYIRLLAAAAAAGALSLTSLAATAAPAPSGPEVTPFAITQAQGTQSCGPDQTVRVSATLNARGPGLLRPVPEWAMDRCGNHWRLPVRPHARLWSSNRHLESDRFGCGHGDRLRQLRITQRKA